MLPVLYFTFQYDECTLVREEHHMQFTSKIPMSAAIAVATAVAGIGLGPAAVAAPANPTDAAPEKMQVILSTPVGYRWATDARALQGQTVYYDGGTLETARRQAPMYRVVPAAAGYFTLRGGSCLGVGGFGPKPSATVGVRPTTDCDAESSQWILRDGGLVNRTYGAMGSLTASYAATEGGEERHYSAIGRGAKELTASRAAMTAAVTTVDVEDRTATLTGTALAGAELRFTGGRTLVVPASGTWTTTIADLRPGENVITVEQYVDGALKEDESVTATLTGAALDAAVAWDSTDPYANAVVSGTAEKGAVVEAFMHGKPFGSGRASSTTGAFSFSIDAPDIGGDAVLTVKQKIGDEYADDVETLTVGYGAGVQLETPVDGADHDGGTVTFTGGGAADARIVVREQGHTAPIASGQVQGDGRFSVSSTDSLDDTEHVLEVTQTSKGNNVTTSTVTLNPGAGESLPAPSELAVTFDEAVFRKAVVTGRVAPNAEVKVLDGSTVVGSGTAGADGMFSVQIDPQSAGKHTLTVQQHVGDDTSQAEVVADYGHTFTVNTPPATKNSTHVELSGQAPAGAQVSFRDNTGETRTATANASGQWAATGFFRPDTTSVTLAAHSQGALVQRATTDITVQVTTRPITVTSPTQADANEDKITDGDVTFTGTATPFSTVQFATWPGTEGRLLFTAYADADGNWKATGWLGKSYYKLVGTQYAIGGDTNQYSMFAFSTVGFTQAVVTTPPADGIVRSGTPIRLSGTATPGSTVTITNGAERIAAPITQGDGTWTAWATFTDATTYTLVAEQQALNGKTSTTEFAPFTTETFHKLDQMNVELTGTSAAFTMRAQPGATVQIWTGPKEQPWARQITSGTADEFGKVTLGGYLTPNNPYQLKVYQTSTDGNQTADWNFTTPAN